MKIGVLGGTFNPIHNGHIQMAEFSYYNLSLDKILIIPTNIPPHKYYNNKISAKDRIDMCKLATTDYNYIEVSDLEIKRDGISYTFLTLEEIKNKYEDSHIYFIIGADMFLTLQEWKKPFEIFKLATICVFNRSNIDKNILEDHYKKLSLIYGSDIKVIFLNTKIVDISSTDIRHMVQNGFNIEKFVPKVVKQYIIYKKLYV